MARQFTYRSLRIYCKMVATSMHLLHRSKIKRSADFGSNLPIVYLACITKRLEISLENVLNF